MKKIIVLLTLIVSVCIASDVQDPGGYQGAKWGMTFEQVKAVFPNVSWKEVAKKNVAGKPKGFKDNFNDRPSWFLFFFDANDKLYKVELLPKGGLSVLLKEFPVIMANLRAKYGDPVIGKEIDNSTYVININEVQMGHTKVEARWELPTTVIVLRIERDMTGVGGIEVYRPLLEYWDKKAITAPAPSNKVQDQL